MSIPNQNRRQAYTEAERVRFAELIRLYGARGAREALARTVCLQTLLKIAVEFGINLKRGRRLATMPCPNTAAARNAA